MAENKAEHQSASLSEREAKIARMRKIMRKVYLIAAGIFLLSCIGGCIFIINVSNNLPPLNEIENPQMDLSTQIYSADGQKLGTYHAAENRVFIALQDMAPVVKDALIATEDIRFEDHSGIDPYTPFTIIKDLVTKFSLRGGSSISQQLARNLYNQIGKDRSITRKVKEAIVAVVLESKFTKDEIMQAYLNSTSFYGNTYGIEMGSQTLFGKSASDLELHEAALMIGLLKGPTLYNPRRDPERALNRRNTVLSQMEKYGKIGRAEAKAAKEMDLGLNYSPGGDNASLAPYFKDRVRRELKTILQSTGKSYNLYTDGLKVYTTLDARMQRYAEKAVREHLSELQKTFMSELHKRKLPWKEDPGMLAKAIRATDRYRSLQAAGKSDSEIDRAFEKKIPMRIWTWEGVIDTNMTPVDSVIHYLTFLQTGMMSMDPHTGEIKAWVGGIDFRQFKYDHVQQSKRQVGSTFKPIVYSVGMDEGRHKPCDGVLDIPVSFELPDGKVWTPSNSGGKDDGLISYYEGLARSKNQVTAYLMKEVGPSAVCRRAKALGITTELDCVPSLCLGTTDLSVYEMVGAYSTFVNDGNYIKPYMISKIEDKNGNVIWSANPEIREVMDPQTAFTMVRMLQGVVDHLKGTGHRLRTKYKFKNQIGGKTGTTQDNSDGWFMGITPNLVTGVWVGCDERRIRFKRTLYGQGANMALPIWAIYMKYVYADKDIGLPETPFVAPEGYKEWACEPLKKEPSLWEDLSGDLPENPYGAL